MIIVLDTNIIFADPLLRKAGFDILLDYVAKTNSRIVLPQIAFEELEASYRREVAERVTKARREVEKLNGMIVNTVEVPHIDVDQAVGRYLNVVREKLGHRFSTHPYTEDNLRNAIQRAIQRRKPCSDSGEEIRDAVLWNSVLDLAAVNPTEDVVFISNNVRQFAVNEELHPDLRNDVEIRGVRLTYLTSLDAFGKTHASQVAFVTRDWVDAKIPSDQVTEQIRDLVIDEARNAIVGEGPFRYNELDVVSVDSRLALNQFYVYTLSDGRMRLSALWFGHILITFTGIMSERSMDLPDHAVGLMKSVTVASTHYKPVQLVKDLRASATVEATIENGEITEWTVVNGHASEL